MLLKPWFMRSHLSVLTSILLVHSKAAETLWPGTTGRRGILVILVCRRAHGPRSALRPGKPQRRSPRESQKREKASRVRRLGRGRSRTPQIEGTLVQGPPPSWSPRLRCLSPHSPLSTPAESEPVRRLGCPWSPRMVPRWSSQG